MLPRINCHVHVFPLKVATTEWAVDVVQARLRHEVVEQVPDFLHEKGQDLVDGFVIGIPG